MTTKEKQLASDMLELASEQFSNHGCNDVEPEIYDGWSLEERRQFIKEYREWNGDPNDDTGLMHVPDWAIMKFMAYKLSK